MLSPLPSTTDDFKNWPWEKIAPYAQELIARPLVASGLAQWMADWTQLSRLLFETYNRLYVATTLDTTDPEAESQYAAFIDGIFPRQMEMDQKLKEKLLASGLEPQGFEIPLRNMKAEAALFREANLPLLAEEMKLQTEYDKISGAQTVEWEGKEITVTQLRPVYQDENRAKRERAWLLGISRQLADREKLNALWVRFMNLRRQIAANAGLPDYRAYRWQQYLRFDYTPEDCASFHKAIEQTVVPAAERLYAKRARQLGVSSLRPWDLDVDTLGRQPLRPYGEIAELEQKSAQIFQRVAPQLGEHFETMRAEQLLDLDNRKGKGPGAYCTAFNAIRRPFIFMNAVGLHDDVQTMLHECGHAFHVFESAHLPYEQQLQVGMEFAEVASMGMELLAAPYLPASEGGFYSAQEASRARVEHLEKMILFWPYMAVVDAFQQWVYVNHEAATNPDDCDEEWAKQWWRFMRGIDYNGMEDVVKTGWHRKLHIFQLPFYYVEYGLAQLGAAQVWRNALKNQNAAVAAYRHALSLGCTVTLPQLYAAAGAKFAFDAQTLGEAVKLIEETIEALEG